MLKKSAVILNDTLSVSAVFLPNDESKFQYGSPRIGFARPVRPSLLICTFRKSPNTAAGSANRLSPVPLLTGLPVVPIPFVPVSPPSPELPNALGFRVGTLRPGNQQLRPLPPIA